MYLEPADYSGNIPAQQLEERLKNACRDIDGLTFNRIVRQGFDNLTEFQKGLIREAVKLHADFVYDNGDMLDSPLSFYGISGVSMTFERSKVVSICGVTTSSAVYNLLMQTGLCYRGIA